MTEEDRNRLLALAVRGDSFRAIAAALGCGHTAVHRVWSRYASPEQKRERQRAQAGYGRWRHRAVLDEFLEAARQGEPWAALGRRYYPDRPSSRATEAAWNTFCRHATDADRAARRAALRARNFNVVPGKGQAAARRRIALGLDNLFAGECFR